MNYRVFDVGESDAGRVGAEWDSFVAAAHDSTHFHQYGWRSVIEGSFGHSSDYLIARDDRGSVAGVLPLVRVKSAVFGDFMVSMPFLNYGGPLGDDAARSALVERAVELAKSRRVDLLELRCRSPQDLSLRASTRKITVVMDLPGEQRARVAGHVTDAGAQAGGAQRADGRGKAKGGTDVAVEEAPSGLLWKSLNSKVRSQVRRPMKEGVEVHFGADRVRDFFRVFAPHMRDLGTPTLPLSFFERAASVFGDSMWFGVAYLGSEPVACGCGFEWQGEFEMTWASSARKHNRISPNMLLYWAFMERAADARLKTFNFGRCTPDGGTHRFKRQWNSRDEQLWWYQHSRTGVESAPSPGGKYAVAQAVWRHLPEPVATALGPFIVRYIP